MWAGCLQEQPDEIGLVASHGSNKSQVRCAYEPLSTCTVNGTVYKTLFCQPHVWKVAQVPGPDAQPQNSCAGRAERINLSDNCSQG